MNTATVASLTSPTISHPLGSRTIRRPYIVEPEPAPEAQPARTSRRSIRGLVLPIALLGVRVWVASQWLNAGLHKITEPAWMDGSGRGLLKFWTTALGTTANGQPVVTFDWYRAFLQLLVEHHAETWFAKLIACGEVAVGLGLLLGCLTGFAALGGLTMNMSYMLAGATSINPVLALLAGVLLIRARSAGSIGLDRFLFAALAALSQRHARRPMLAQVSSRAPLLPLAA